MSVRHTRFEVESLAVQLYSSFREAERAEPIPRFFPGWNSIAVKDRSYWRAAAVHMLDEETTSLILIGNDSTWRNHWTGDGR